MHGRPQYQRVATGCLGAAVGEAVVQGLHGTTFPRLEREHLAPDRPCPAEGEEGGTVRMMLQTLSAT